MALKHAVLAALLEGEASGYELSKRFDVSVANFWPATPQQMGDTPGFVPELFTYRMLPLLLERFAITQGLLPTMAADTAPPDLRGTAFGFFNLVSGVAMLLASLCAGLLWDSFGAAFTFYAGAAFSLVALAVLFRRPAGFPVSRAG